MRKATVIPFRRRARQPPAFLGLVLALVAGAVLGGLLATYWKDISERFAAPSATSPRGQPIARSSVRVVDGDTIDLAGRRVRLIGFNAPETWQPACPTEAELGNRAKRRLREMIAREDLSYLPVACSCPPGTEGTETCNHGRACGSLFAAGRDVGEILIAEQLAVPYACGRTHCPPLPRPWCG